MVRGCFVWAVHGGDGEEFRKEKDAKAALRGRRAIFLLGQKKGRKKAPG